MVSSGSRDGRETVRGRSELSMENIVRKIRPKFGAVS